MKKILFTILTLSVVFCTFQAAYSQGIELGPMLGHVSNEGANIWIKVKDHSQHSCCTVKVIASTDPNFSTGNVSCVDTVAAQSQSAWRTITMKIQDLTPSAKYYYRVYIDGESEQSTDTTYNYFKTAPHNGKNSHFRFVFTSCIGRNEEGNLQIPPYGSTNISPVQALREAWRDLHNISDGIDFLLLLGDNHYANSTDRSTLVQRYSSQRKDLFLQKVTRHLPTYAIWDDHDFAPDSGTFEANRYSEGKEISLEVFKRYWPNPSFGAYDTDGVWFKFSYGDVDFFMLDGRYNRDSSNAKDDIGKSMLGERQLKWLKDKLECSDAKIKFIACGSEWNSDSTECDKETIGGDGWSRYRTERDNLFQYIIDEEIEGVVFLSGDRHRTTGYQIFNNKFIEISSGSFAADWHTANVRTYESFMDQYYGNFFSIFDVSASSDPPLILSTHRVHGNGRTSEGDKILNTMSFSWDEVNGKKEIPKHPANHLPPCK